MYGAYWCPHCQAQKKLFGPSFQHLKYVECTVDVKLCQEQKIESYPTWIFADGTRISGELSLADLAQKTSCQPPTP
jgi:glutaredoxin